MTEERCWPWTAAPMQRAAGSMLTHGERRHQQADACSAGKRCGHLADERKSIRCCR